MNNNSAVTRAYLALGALCIIWSTTYTFIKIAVEEQFPPYLMVGVRQTTAGILLLALAFMQGKLPKLKARYVLLQSLTGLAMITGGNGFITWGMQYVSSGLAAVIGSLTPVLVVLINLGWKGTEVINRKVLLGVLLGFAGMGIIFNDGWADFLNPDYRLGIVACFGSCLTWSLGTVMAKRFNSKDISPLVNAGLQIIAGGIGGFILSAFFDHSHALPDSFKAWGAISYLALVGSAVAFSLYMYVLKHLSATVSSLYTYINPVLAIMLGWIFLHESFSPGAMLGIAFTLAGVWMVNNGQRAGSEG